MILRNKVILGIIFTFILLLGFGKYIEKFFSYLIRLVGGRKKMFGNKTEKNYYELKVACTNCKAEGVRKVPKGTSIDEYMKAAKCNQCGCATLKQVSGEMSVDKMLTG